MTNQLKLEWSTGLISVASVLGFFGLFGCCFGWNSSPVQPVLETNQSRYAIRIAIAPDGNTVAGISKNIVEDPKHPDFHKQVLCFWTIPNSQPAYSEILPQESYSVAFSHDSTRAAVAVGAITTRLANNSESDGRPREIRIYSVLKKELIWTEKYDRAITSCEFSPDGKFLATITPPDGALSPELIVWDIEKKKPITKLTNIDWPASVVRYSRDGKTLAINTTVVTVVQIKGAKATGSRTPVVRLLDAGTLEKIKDITAYEVQPSTGDNDIQDFHFLSNDRLAMRQNSVAIIDLATNAATHLPDITDQHRYHVKRELAVSADGERIAVATWLPRHSSCNQFYIWDARKAVRVSQFTMPSFIHGAHTLAISPDKKTLAVGWGKIHLVEIK